MNNLDMQSLLKMLNTMDKKTLAENLSKVGNMLNSKDADKIIDEIKKNNNI